MPHTKILVWFSISEWTFSNDADSHHSPNHLRTQVDADKVMHTLVQCAVGKISQRSGWYIGYYQEIVKSSKIPNNPCTPVSLSGVTTLTRATKQTDPINLAS